MGASGRAGGGRQAQGAAIDHAVRACRLPRRLALGANRDAAAGYFRYLADAVRAGPVVARRGQRAEEVEAGERHGSIGRGWARLLMAGLSQGARRMRRREDTSSSASPAGRLRASSRLGNSLVAGKPPLSAGRRRAGGSGCAGIRMLQFNLGTATIFIDRNLCWP